MSQENRFNDEDIQDPSETLKGLKEMRSQLQETLNSHLFRLDALEKQLALENLDEDKREAMERELGEVKKLLQINYDALKELQMQQRSQIPFIFYVMGATMFCYLMWKMWTNPY